MPGTARYLVEHAYLGNKVMVLTDCDAARRDGSFGCRFPAWVPLIAALSLLEPGACTSA